MNPRFCTEPWFRVGFVQSVPSGRAGGPRLRHRRAPGGCPPGPQAQRVIMHNVLSYQDKMFLTLFG